MPRNYTSAEWDPLKRPEVARWPLLKRRERPGLLHAIETLAKSSKQLALPAVLILFLLGAAFQIVRIAGSIGLETQLDYGEGIVLWQASQVFDLKSAFHPLQQYPHVVFHYTPIYHIAVRIVAAVLRDPLLSGRTISTAAALWIVGLLAWTVLKATRGYAPAGIRWFGALLTCALCLQVPAMRWVPLARVDMLGLAFQFTALSLITVRPFRLRIQIVAACLLLLGLYTKQSLVAIPAASLLIIGIVRPARAVWIATGLLATGLGVFFVLFRATDGGVLRHWVLYNMNPFSLFHALTSELRVARNLAALIAIGFAAAWLTFPTLNRSNPRSWRAVSTRVGASALRRTGVGFGLAATIGFFFSWGIGKAGSNINYCLDWELALCPLAGIFMVLFLRAWAREDTGMRLLRPLLVFLLGTVALQLGLGSVIDCDHAIGLKASTRESRLKEVHAQAELVKLVSSFPGPVVSCNILALLRAGKPVPIEPEIVRFTTMKRAFDETELVRRTLDGFFDAFVFCGEVGESNYTPNMQAAILQTYRPDVRIADQYTIYVRKHPPTIVSH